MYVCSRYSNTLRFFDSIVLAIVKIPQILYQCRFRNFPRLHAILSWNQFCTRNVYSSGRFCKPTVVWVYFFCRKTVAFKFQICVWARARSQIFPAVSVWAGFFDANSTHSHVSPQHCNSDWHFLIQRAARQQPGGRPSTCSHVQSLFLVVVRFVLVFRKKSHRVCSLSSGNNLCSSFLSIKISSEVLLSCFTFQRNVWIIVLCCEWSILGGWNYCIYYCVHCVIVVKMLSETDAIEFVQNSRVGQKNSVAVAVCTIRHNRSSCVI